MKERGQIVEVTEDGLAVVKIKRSSYCSSCGACNMGAHQDEMLLTIPNRLKGEPGDLVELDLEATSILKASAIAYLIPLAALLIGVVLGYVLAYRVNGNAELFGAIGGILMAILAFLGIRMMEPIFRRQRKYSPQMVTIIKQFSKGDGSNG